MEAPQLSNFPRNKNLPVSGPMLQAKAQSFAEMLGLENFHASNGWLSGFKSRHGLTFKSIFCEASAVDNAVVGDWHNDELKKILREFEPKNIFNCDETGMFWKLLPNKTMTLKGES